MLPSTFDPHNPNAKQCQDILDEAMSMGVKSTTFQVLYAITRLAQQNPGQPVTVLQIVTKSGVGERSTRAAVKELRKALLIDITETPEGNVFEFVPPAPEANHQVGGGASFSGRYTSTQEVVEEEKVETSLQEHLTGDKYAPETRAHHPGRLNIFSPEVQDLVDHFEELVTPHSKQRITARRRAKFYESVVHLVFVQKRALSEIHRVFTWLFTTWHGFLPFAVPFDDRKITRVRQISMNYDRIVAVMGEAA